MEQLTESKWFRLLVWLMLGLISLYFVWLLRPLFLDVYRFLKAVLAPFLVAMIISYVLNPVVCMLSDRKVPRSMAVLIIYAVFLTSLAVILINMIPMLIRQLEELNEHLPELTMNAQSLMTNLDSRLLPPGVRTGMNSWFFQMESRLAGGITAFMDNIGNTITLLEQARFEVQDVEDFTAQTFVFEGERYGVDAVGVQGGDHRSLGHTAEASNFAFELIVDVAIAATDEQIWLDSD